MAKLVSMATLIYFSTFKLNPMDSPTKFRHNLNANLMMGTIKDEDEELGDLQKFGIQQQKSKSFTSLKMRCVLSTGAVLGAKDRRA